MFGVSKSGYYSWIDRKVKKAKEQTKLEKEDLKIKAMMIDIRSKLCYTPGKRTFKAEIFDKYGLHVSVKRCAKLMKEMHITASRPKKDSYKGQAVHDHVCASPENAVCQNFYIGVRRVIMTDITYLYYGIKRTPAYLCVFKDAYTKEILGHALSRKMDVNLIRAAYEMMMNNHKDEFPTNVNVFCHSDQGSQYLSTTFEQLLSDDNFIHSVSSRGNSQDNAPCESFFARLKCHIIDLIARCPDFDTANEIIDGYMHNYNHVAVQYNIGGLTPHDFYLYKETGNLPLRSYFGIDESKLISIKEHRALQLYYAEKKNEKRRRAYEHKHEKDKEKRLIDPHAELKRDRRLVISRISNTRAILEKLDNLLERIEAAISYFTNLDEESKELLRNPLEWKNHPELHFIYDMNGMF